MSKHTSSHRSRRSNPTDWFGYSVADEIKVTVVHTPITQVRDVSGNQTRGWKPIGLWYACGGEWIEWLESEMPEWLEDGKYLYEVRPNYSAGGLAAGRYGDYVGGVLRLSTEEEVVEFSRTYSNFEKVDWYEVSSIWDGIEICPYQDDLRLSMHNWYYPWDVASGCIWRPSGLASPLVLLKSRESASVSPRRGVDRGNPRRLPVRRNGLLGGLVLAGAAFAGGVYAEKTSSVYDRVKAVRAPKMRAAPVAAPVAQRPADTGWTSEPEMGGKGTIHARVISGDTYQIFARRGGPFFLDVLPFGSDRPTRLGEYATLKEAKARVPASGIPARRNSPKSNPSFAPPPTRQQMEAASDRFFSALEQAAGEKQVLYMGPFTLVGDQRGGILGKLEIRVSVRQSDGALSVHLAYIGVNRDERQQGRGTRLMQIVLAAADAARLPVDLEVDPQTERGDAKPPMNKKQLREFYKKFGFRTVRGMGSDYMERDVPPRANPRRR